MKFLPTLFQIAVLFQVVQGRPSASFGVDRVLEVRPGGGWLSDTAKELEGSAGDAKSKAFSALDSYKDKAKDAAKNAKAKADSEWLKKVSKLEDQLEAEKAKATARLEKEQEKLLSQAEKEKTKLMAKIDKLTKELEAK